MAKKKTTRKARKKVTKKKKTTRGNRSTRTVVKKARKRTSTRRQGAAGAVSGEIADINDFEIQQGGPGFTIYGEMSEKMGKLQRGQAFAVEVPDGVTPKQFHARLNSAMKRAQDRGVTPPKGCRFIKRTSEDKASVVIACVPAT